MFHLFRKRYLFSIIAVASLSPQTLAAPAENGYVMKQTSDEYGILETSMTSSALRLDTPDLTILLLPPKYPLYIYNRKNKRFIEEPTDAFTVHTRPNAIKPHLKVDKKDDVSICGIKSTRYLCTDTRQSNKIPRFEFCATKNLNVPGKLADACMIFFSIPEMEPGHGIPLTATRLSPSGKKFSYVMTRSIEKAFVPPEKFAKPKGYARVDNFVALSSDAENIPAPSAHALDYMMEDSKRH